MSSHPPTMTETDITSTSSTTSSTDYSVTPNNTKMASADKLSYRKTTKPMMEKKRRARINNCLGQLKSLVLQAMKKDNSQYSKLEKADILELTVKHLKHVQRIQAANTNQIPEGLNKYRAGFNECANEVIRYLGETQGVNREARSRILSHLSSILTPVNSLGPLHQQQQQQHQSSHAHILPAPQATSLHHQHHHHQQQLHIPLHSHEHQHGSVVAPIPLLKQQLELSSQNKFHSSAELVANQSQQQLQQQQQQIRNVNNVSPVYARHHSDPLANLIPDYNNNNVSTLNDGDDNNNNNNGKMDKAQFVVSGSNTLKTITTAVSTNTPPSPPVQLSANVIKSETGNTNTNSNINIINETSPVFRTSNNLLPSTSAPSFHLPCIATAPASMTTTPFQLVHSTLPNGQVALVLAPQPIPAMNLYSSHPPTLITSGDISLPVVDKPHHHQQQQQHQQQTLQLKHLPEQSIKQPELQTQPTVTSPIPQDQPLPLINKPHSAHNTIAHPPSPNSNSSSNLNSTTIKIESPHAHNPHPSSNTVLDNHRHHQHHHHQSAFRHPSVMLNNSPSPTKTSAADTSSSSVLNANRASDSTNPNSYSYGVSNYNDNNNNNIPQAHNHNSHNNITSSNDLTSSPPLPKESNDVILSAQDVTSVRDMFQYKMGKRSRQNSDDGRPINEKKQKSTWRPW